MIKVNNKKIIWHKNLTISKLLTKIEFGEQYAVVRLNGEIISKPKFISTFIKNNSEIILLPLIAGG